MLMNSIKPSWVLLCSLTMTGVLASCSMMRDNGGPTPVPIQIPAYEPDDMYNLAYKAYFLLHSLLAVTMVMWSLQIV